ncbi:tagaturonate epimerase family protein [Paraliobacillus sp. X-1268]|uniref:tagaturonate epimerase family protein n=1 Tax=Paraliobacillus sp. X-1268 TaxID=2213193 RepID=UPI000E3CDE23|nr:tagaturonate epimerase family protein [Paraliobacillus sp. X-1268]
MDSLVTVLQTLAEGKVAISNEQVKVYRDSFTEYKKDKLIMVKDLEAKWILAVGDGVLYESLTGETLKGYGKRCALSHENRLVLNQYFPYTVPQAFGTEIATMGLGDRLGLASPGHIETIKPYRVKPILAQQSIRELTLTNRSMIDILDAAAFAVFQEGYKDGYGADGDHIKLEKDIEYALSLGISFLTLDCSDQIRNDLETISVSDIEGEYEKLPAATRDYYYETYFNKQFDVNGLEIDYDKVDVIKNALLYGEALDYTEHVYKTYIQNAEKQIDFEISIDETETITSPAAHFFVANELIRRGVNVTSLAPRFCGEFQKGIDYIGDITQFEKELKAHAIISQYFGYKLSIHSGSDKFSVFPSIGEHTNGLLHIKTAGTNWLEAVRVIAAINPELYRRMHVHALEHFEETLQYYHITPNLDTIAPLEEQTDELLPAYMNHDAARQLFHVTYGILLTAKNDQGKFLFKDAFFQTLNENEDAYRQALVKHIGKHLELLGL